MTPHQRTAVLPRRLGLLRPPARRMSSAIGTRSIADREGRNREEWVGPPRPRTAGRPSSPPGRRAHRPQSLQRRARARPLSGQAFVASSGYILYHSTRARRTSEAARAVKTALTNSATRCKAAAAFLAGMLSGPLTRARCRGLSPISSRVMLIVCPQCATSYQIDRAALGPPGAVRALHDDLARHGARRPADSGRNRAAPRRGCDQAHRRR